MSAKLVNIDRRYNVTYDDVVIHSIDPDGNKYFILYMASVWDQAIIFGKSLGNYTIEEIESPTI